MYCYYDKTKVSDLRLTYEASVLAEMEDHGDGSFDLAMHALQKLALVQIYNDHDGHFGWCRRDHRVIYKLARQCDTGHSGLENLLMTGNDSLVSHYMNSKPELSMISNIIDIFRNVVVSAMTTTGQTLSSAPQQEQFNQIVRTIIIGEGLGQGRNRSVLVEI